MRSAILIFLVLFLFNPGFSQDTKPRQDDYTYNMFSCKDCYRKFFVSTNSGINNTPIGIRFGFFCQTGAYLGTRFGHGEMYGFDQYYPEKTKKTNLFSITTGLIKPIYIYHLVCMDFWVQVMVIGGRRLCQVGRPMVMK